jgi:hypothetical protein
MSQSEGGFERGNITPELTEFVEAEKFSDYETFGMRSLFHAGNSMVKALLRELKGHRMGRSITLSCLTVSYRAELWL